MKYSGRLTKAGLPDRRTSEGRAWFRRSEAAKRGWVSRRLRESEEREPWKKKIVGGGGFVEEIIVEEPIETVGGPRRRSGRRRK